ncbi:SPRY domain-containing protein [Kiloniella sp. EL199]|uniref:SPRY domain-containing protein n=1 Tax=Kiloniella sp. EL199 TaxID=2107581 RepID=UPI000EA25B72|nr:SPRY domain-containing protein [Kiloniella sp. EL199]
MRALYSGTDTSWVNDLEASLALCAGKKLTYTPSVTGNRRQFTVMMNVRRHKFGVLQNILSAGSSWYLSFAATDRLSLYTSAANGGDFSPKRVFRDTEWFFLGIAYDTVARTVKMVINDQEVDEWHTSTLPNANYQSNMNLAGAMMELGAFNGASGDAEVTVSDFVLLDGEVLTPQEMINYRTQNVPFGNNVITTTKKFTTEGQQERFLGLHRTDPASGTTKIEDEGQQISRVTSSWDSIASDILPNTGKFQFEVSLASDVTNLIAGISDARGDYPRANVNTFSQGLFTGAAFNAVGLSTLAYNNAQVNYDPTEWGSTNPHDVFSMYFDMDSRTAILAVNGVEIVAPHPLDSTAENLRIFIDMHSLTDPASVNFGQTDYKYPKAGYGPLKEPAKSDLKRCKLLNGGTLYTIPLKERQLSSASAASGWHQAYSNFTMSTGKIYIEHTDNTSDTNSLGWGICSDLNRLQTLASDTVMGAVADKAVGLYVDAADHYHNTLASTSISGVAGTSGKFNGVHRNGETTKMAFDFDANKYWVGSDDEWENGDPATGAGGYSLPAERDWWLYVSSFSYGGGLFNFGDSPWDQTPPTGFKGPAEFDFDSLRKSGDVTNYEYGPNGTQLLFEDGGNLGKSTAGNLVSWTTPGITSDGQLTDTPGDPYAILSTIMNGASGISHGGTRLSASGVTRHAQSSMPMSSGKWYWEVTISGGANPNKGAVGIVPAGALLSGAWYINENTYGYYGYNGTVYSSNVQGSTGLTYTIGDVIGVALNLDTNEIEFFKNSVSRGKFPVNTGIDYVAAVGQVSSASGSNIWNVNFGQKPFTHSVPAGFKELKSSNREAPKYHGRDKFDVVLRSANNNETKVYPAVKPAVVWTKSRNGSYSHSLYDVVRGAGKYLRPDTTAAEGDYIETLKLFEEDGYTLGTSNESNRAGNNYVDWIFSLDGTENTNNDGSVSSQVITDSSGYMSIATATTLAAGDTLGIGIQDHELTILKERNQAGLDWGVWCQHISDQSGSTQKWLVLNSTIGATGPDGVVFGKMDNGKVTAGTWAGAIGDLITYNFKSVPGLSKVFSYKANGSSKGPFIDLGFKARWVMIKEFSSSGSWNLFDSERNPENSLDDVLYANNSSAEASYGAGDGVDFTANGITIRETSSDLNASAQTYIGLAIADVAGGGDLPAILGN